MGLSTIYSFRFARGEGVGNFSESRKSRELFVNRLFLCRITPSLSEKSRRVG